MPVDASDDLGTAQMARRHEQITAEIAVLKALALEELHNHHPENAAPLLEEALALYSALKGSCPEAQPPRAGQLDDPDFLSADELEVIREGAHRTALDLDEFDPLSELEREKKKFDVTPASDVHVKAGQSPDLIPTLDDLSYSLDEEEPDRTIDLELDDQPLADLTAGLPAPDEYDEAPTREEIKGVRIDSKITRSERARQEAIQLGTKFGWGSDEIDLLTEVFYLHLWSSSKRVDDTRTRARYDAPRVAPRTHCSKSLVAKPGVPCSRRSGPAQLSPPEPHLADGTDRRAALRVRPGP